MKLRQVVMVTAGFALGTLGFYVYDRVTHQQAVDVISAEILAASDGCETFYQHCVDMERACDRLKALDVEWWVAHYPWCKDG